MPFSEQSNNVDLQAYVRNTTPTHSDYPNQQTDTPNPNTRAVQNRQTAMRRWHMNTANSKSTEHTKSALPLKSPTQQQRLSLYQTLDTKSLETLIP